MTGQAKVRSIEALDSFRNSLVLYLTRSRAVLEDAAQEIVRARIWLQTDRQVHWKRQIRLCAAAASQAEQELVTARLSGDTGVVLERRKALAKARDALQHAEEGLARVRRWLQRFPTDVEARGALPHRLQHVLANDGSRAVSFLEAAAALLTDYAGRGTGSAAAAEPGLAGGASVPASANRGPESPLEPVSARRKSPASSGTGAGLGPGGVL